jgi:hypothetical protein
MVVGDPNFKAESLLGKSSILSDQWACFNSNRLYEYKGHTDQLTRMAVNSQENNKYALRIDIFFLTKIYAYNRIRRSQLIHN